MASISLAKSAQARSGFSALFCTAEFDFALAGKVERTRHLVAIHFCLVDNHHGSAVRIHVHGERQVVVFHRTCDRRVTHLAIDTASEFIAVLFQCQSNVERAIRRVDCDSPRAGDIGGERGKRSQKESEDNCYEAHMVVSVAQFGEPELTPLRTFTTVYKTSGCEPLGKGSFGGSIGSRFNSAAHLRTEFRIGAMDRHRFHREHGRLRRTFADQFE
jgi:hypothetical protein